MATVVEPREHAEETVAPHPTTPERMERTWETKPGLMGFFGTVDHKTIGKRYMVTAFVFFSAAGIEAMLIRTQLIRPENRLLTPEAYNQLFSMHGTTMIFFFATPMLFGFGNFIVPLLIGARDMAFPRLNAFGYWVLLLAGIFTYSSFIIGQAPDGGWFNYVPLTSETYSPGLNIDFYCLGLIFLSISTTAGSANFIVTVFKMRAPGMSLNRIPLFIWNLVVTAFSVLFALPSLTTGAALLEFQRRWNFPFFDSAAGGNPLLWQHLFWIFGHPDVYIIFLPAVGIVSEIVPTFSRRPMVGYTWVAMATVTTGIVAFGVWVHHMFATGLSLLSLSFFGAASLIIVIPSGVQMFAWLGTSLIGRPVLKTPFLFALGFMVLFVVGGVTGVMFAAVPFDWQVTDSYFVVAHFHYVLFGGAVFPIFGGFYYWIPKMTGKLLDEKLGALNFWLMFIGFNLTFFPMHIVGLLGMPRRTYTYQAGLGWDGLNLLETIGAYILGIGILVFVFNFVRSMRSGEPAGENPWHGSTLEWSTSSPPPVYNFAVLPTVRSRDPLWDQDTLGPGLQPAGRSTLGTTTLVAQASHLIPMPEDSLWPIGLALALSVLFVGFLITAGWLIGLGVVLVMGSIIGWLWPTRPVGIVK